ncbi:hypothetical protein SFRURICE_005337 [Spodoptera frugiperda]|nr:hypothetical protein SFRURICE_005337 [Spodoptera frugiperda]
MVQEILFVNGNYIPHAVVDIEKDGACLFRALSFLMFGTQDRARDVRERIIGFVIENWTEFSIMSCTALGDNYSTPNEYYNDMMKTTTYGSLCELEAAGRIYEYVFEVLRDGQFYVKTGVEGLPVKRLRFTGGLSGGLDTRIKLGKISKKSQFEVTLQHIGKRLQCINETTPKFIGKHKLLIELHILTNIDRKLQIINIHTWRNEEIFSLNILLGRKWRVAIFPLMPSLFPSPASKQKIQYGRW